MKILILDDESQVGTVLAGLLDSIPRVEYRVMPPVLLSGAATGAAQQIHYFRPDFVVNTHSIEQAESEYGLDKAHMQTVKELCRAANQVGAAFIHVSSAMVFDSARGGLFSEHDRPRPRSVVSRQLADLERCVIRYSENHVILRCGWIFGPSGHGMFEQFLIRLERGEDIILHAGLRCAPTPASDVAEVVCAMMQQLDCGANCWGIFHYSSSDTTTSKDFAETVITLAANYGKVDIDNVHLIDGDEFEHYGVPYHPIVDCRKILNCYGIKQRPWRSAMTTILRAIYEPG